jgi:CRISPR/Cas system-associated exonuclease Cas4 (RecB family)
MSHRFTALSKYDACALAYRYMIEGRPTLDAKIMQDGSRAHDAYFRYAKHCLDTGNPTDLTAMPAIAAAVGIRPHGDLYCEVIESWLDAGHLFPRAEIIGIEERFAIDVNGNSCAPEAPEAWLAGTVDVLRTWDAPDAARIVDYKTGFDSHANPLQMKIYAWLTFAQFPHLNRIACEFDYTRFNVQREKVFTREDIPAIEAQVHAIVEAIESDADFAASPGEHCQTCQWRDTCEAKPECVQAVITETDAHAAVEAIGLLSRDLERQKDLLRVYCTENGPVAWNGVVWGHHAQGDDGFDDPVVFADACHAAGIDPWEFLSVNNTKARKLCRRGVWPEALQNALVNRRNTAFRAKKEVKS